MDNKQDNQQAYQQDNTQDNLQDNLQDNMQNNQQAYQQAYQQDNMQDNQQANQLISHPDSQINIPQVNIVLMNEFNNIKDKLIIVNSHIFDINTIRNYSYFDNILTNINEDLEKISIGDNKYKIYSIDQTNIVVSDKEIRIVIPITFSDYSAYIFKLWLYKYTINIKQITSSTIVEIYKFSKFINCNMFNECRFLFQYYIDNVHDEEIKYILNNVTDLDIPAKFQSDPGNNLWIRAHCHEYGICGFNKDLVKAYKLYGLCWSSTKNYNALAKIAENNFLKKEINVAVDLLQIGVKANNRKCLNMLALHYLNTKKYIRSYELYQYNWVINQDAEALSILANLLLHGTGCAKNETKAIEYYKLSDKLFSNIHSTYILGLCYLNGVGTDKNVEMAYSYFHHGYINNYEKSVHMIGKLVEHNIIKGDHVDIYTYNWNKNKYADSLVSLIKYYSENDTQKANDLTIVLKNCGKVLDGVAEWGYVI